MKYIMPQSHNLSFDEIGLLTTMLNIETADYCTLEELCELSSNNSINTSSILNQLVSKNYVKVINNKYFINKQKIFEMKLIAY